MVLVPSEMRAAHICQYGETYKLVTTPIPAIRSHELLVRIHAAGFCHSDVQILHGQFKASLPMIPLHEPAGVVVKVGAECDGFWKVGDRVGVLNFKNACSKCTGCALSLKRHHKLDPRLCLEREMTGFANDGCLAEYMVADPATTVLLPDTLSFDQGAPLMCAGATVWAALEKATADVEPGATVTIVGIGGLGHLGIQFARARGFRTIAVDSREAARGLALEVPEGLAPDLVVDSTASANAAASIFEFTDGEGCAAVVVCADDHDLNAWSLTLLRFGGTMVVLGLPPDPWRFDASLMALRELTIKGNYVASIDSTKRMMQLVERFQIASHVTKVSFEDSASLLRRYHDGNFRGRLVVEIAQ